MDMVKATRLLQRTTHRPTARAYRCCNGRHSMLCSLLVIRRRLQMPLHLREFDLWSKARVIRTPSVLVRPTSLEVTQGPRLLCRSA